jgi:hypothetical protein
MELARSVLPACRLQAVSIAYRQNVNATRSTKPLTGRRTIFGEAWGDAARSATMALPSFLLSLHPRYYGGSSNR